MENEELENKIDASASHSQCANCGGNLFFDPSSQSLKCPNCDSKFPINSFINLNKKPLGSVERFGNHDEWVKQAKIAKCETCGAEVILDGLNITTKCPYCASDYVLSSKAIDGIRPDAVLPFSFDANSAADFYVKGIKKKFWAPRAFKKKLPTTNVRGIYVSSFAFDSSTSSTYKGVLLKDVKRRHGDKVVTVTESIRINGTKDLNFVDVIIESSSKMENKDMKALLPYNFENSLQNFNPDYLRGFSSEHYDEDVEISFDKAKKEMENDIKNNILAEYRRKYSYDRVDSFTMNTNYSNEKYSYRLLPVYCFEFMYRKKKYITFMNGQTGKIGTGYPRSVGKKVVIALLVVLAVAGLITLAILSKK